VLSRWRLVTGKPQRPARITVVFSLWLSFSTPGVQGLFQRNPDVQEDSDSQNVSSRGFLGCRKAGVHWVRVGPLSDDTRMKMSILTRDYHPLGLLREVVAAGGLAGLRLHPAWIPGLVDMGLKSIARGARITSVRINYVQPMYQRDTLTLELVRGEEVAGQDETVILLRVLNQRRDVTAEGSARLSPAHESRTVGEAVHIRDRPR
jgi:hypothetical protein